MKKLEEDFPELDFYTLKDCLDELNWEYDEIEEGNYENIVCDCGRI